MSDYVFKMITNRRGRPISVFARLAEKPNPKEYEGSYIDPADGAQIEIELGGSWLEGSCKPPTDAFEVKLKKIK
jgi:hypothetical protein